MTKRTTKPRITELASLLGPVPVVYVDEVLSDSGKPLDAIGHCSFRKRRIQIKDGLPPETEAHTLRHEWVHLMLWDFGANHISGKREETVCDIIASALLAYPVPT